MLSFIEHRVVKFSCMHPMAKNYPFIHKPYTLCVLCVLRGEFLQWTHYLVGNRSLMAGKQTCHSSLLRLEMAYSYSWVGKHSSSSELLEEKYAYSA